MIKLDTIDHHSGSTVIRDFDVMMTVTNKKICLVSVVFMYVLSAVSFVRSATN